VYLGKSTSATFAPNNLKYFGFSNIGHMSSGEWRPDGDGCARLQHFLMVHRSHELRVLPEYIEQYATEQALPSGFPTNEEDDDPDYNLIDFFKQNAGTPDPHKEADDLPLSLVDRLRRISADSK
jgi:hypothetical protein